MSTTVVRKQRLHRPTEAIPTFFYQNECETEPNISQTRAIHADKFVFHDSDEEEFELPLRNTTNSQHPSYNSNIVRNNSQRISRARRPLSKQFKGNVYAMKPSIMQSQKDKDESYDDIVNCEVIDTSSRVHRSSHKVKAKVATAPKMDNFIEELISKKTDNKDTRAQLRRFHKLTFSMDDEEEVVVKQVKQSIVPPLKQQKEHKEQEKIIIPKIPVSSLYFEDSEEETTNKQQSNPPLESDIKSRDGQKGSIASKDQQQTQSHHQSAKQLSPNKQDIPNVDITLCKHDPQLAQRSLYLEEYLRKKIIPEERNRAMNAPTLPGTKLVFEVHVYSTLTEKQYFLWLEMGTQMMLLMRARKYTHINRTQFELTTYIENTKEYLESCRMVSNFDRTRYNILQEERSTGKHKLLGTLCSSVSLNNNKTIVLYYPKLNEKYLPTIFYQHTTDQDLQTVYRENKIQEVEFMVTTKLQMTRRLQIMSQYQLRASQKSMEFKSPSNQMKVIIGKRGSKRYKLVVGPGVAPVQLFCLAVVQIQT